MNKVYYVTAVVLLILISVLGVTYSFEYDDDADISFEILGPEILYMDVNTKYTEYGIKVLYNGRDVSKFVKIDTSKLKIDILGQYKVKYQFGNEYVYRDVVVIDKESLWVCFTSILEGLGDELVAADIQ